MNTSHAYLWRERDRQRDGEREREKETEREKERQITGCPDLQEITLRYINPITVPPCVQSNPTFWRVNTCIDIIRHLAFWCSTLVFDNSPRFR